MWQILLLCVAVYLPTLRYTLVIDDIDHAKALPSIKYHHLHQRIFFRLYGCNTFGTNLVLDHAITLTLHTITCMLIAYTFHSTLAGILYTIHPCNHQTAIWLNGRRYQIVAILTLLAISTNNPIPLLLSVCFQYTAVPVFFLMPAAMIAAPIGWILCRSRVLSQVYHRRKLTPKITPRPSEVTALFAYNLYRLTAIPKISHAYPFAESRRYHPSWSIAGTALLATGVLVAPHIPYVGIACLCVLQWSGVVPIHQLCADRYLNIANIFICVLLAIYAPILSIALIPLYVLRTVSLMPMYRNIHAFYEYHAKLYPSMKRLALIKHLYLL